tara:strand:- start:238 stop:489 length:252 start_codon:yes stop_codon:yes gene_type:complete
MNDKFFDELINGEPLLCSTIQMSIIESLLKISPISTTEKEEIYMNLDSYSEEEANDLIYYLKQDVVITDPKDQWQKMFKENNY